MNALIEFLISNSNPMFFSGYIMFVVDIDPRSLCKWLEILTVVPTNAMYSDDCKHTANVSVDFSEEELFPEEKEMLLTIISFLPSHSLHSKISF